MSKTNTKIVENGFFNCKLTIKYGEDLSISVRPDGFVNATQLCKAGKKKFNNWFQTNETKDLIQTLESDTGKTASQLIDVKKGKSNRFEEGSWIHPDLAVQLAQWISPHFGLQVSKFVDEMKNKEQKQLQIKTLDLGNHFSIENRLEDGYINVTSLCKAGGKQFNDWNRLSKTRTFLEVISRSTGIPADLLINMNTGGNGERHTWVHPQVAINIAQWISTEFELQVKKNIDELKIKEQKQLQISNLDLGNGFIIENRLEDGYINVTSLCKVGKKQFKSWNRL
ncbi:MAG: KilA-N domain-containing protein, partial [bacterium]